MRYFDYQGWLRIDTILKNRLHDYAVFTTFAPEHIELIVITPNNNHYALVTVKEIFTNTCGTDDSIVDYIEMRLFGENKYVKHYD